MMRMRPRPLVGRPLVSVVVPCYNYGRFLPDAVRSVLDQPGVDVEVIIVDDASTDDSLAVALRMAADDARVSVVSHPRNLGHIATYNDGLARVRGELVVLLSADDMLAPGSLARSAALFEAKPEIGLVYGYAPELDGDVPPSRGRLGSAGEPAASWSQWRGHDWIRRVCRRGTNIIVNPEAVMRRSLLERLGGGYDAEHPHAADMALWLRAAANADVGRINGPAQAYYRVHGGNMHLTEFAGALRDATERARVFEALRAKGSISPALHRTALRALAREALRTARRSVASGAPAGTAVAFAEWAAECRPTIRRTPTWWAYRTLGGHRPGPLQRLELAVDRLRWSLAWRRWRRFGT